METASTQRVIRQTKHWIDDIVIGLNLCPFAAPVVRKNLVDYLVVSGDNMEQHLHQLADNLNRLDHQKNIETSLLIYPQAYKLFDDYLDFLHLANQLLEEMNYSGVYQLASFHPNYCFEACTDDDAGNFTNRSPYPMLHLLRESSLEKAIASYENIEDVPKNNVIKLRQIGYKTMQQTLKNILLAD